jgi:hypothetical protein
MKQFGLLISCSLAVVLAAQAIAASENNSVPRPKRPNSTSRVKQPPPPPITYSELLTDVQQLDLKNAKVSPALFVDSVRQRCIGFAGTLEQFQELKAAGAPDELLALIPRVPAPPPPPKPPVAGILTVNCRPVDCKVLVDGRDRGKTTNGIMQVSGLRPEETWIEVRQDGYQSRTDHLVLEADKPTLVKFELEVAPVVAERAGVDLFWHLLRGFHAGGSALRSGSLSAGGVMTFTSKTGQTVQRDVLVEIGLPESVRVITLNSGHKRQCTASYKVAAKSVDFACEARKTPDEALKPEIEEAASLLASYYPLIVIDRILASKVQLIGTAVGSSAPVLLRAVGDVDSWQFGLNKDSYLPDWIGYTGPDKITWTAEFANYQNQSVFPQKVVIHDHANKHRSEFIFNRVELKR